MQISVQVFECGCGSIDQTVYLVKRVIRKLGMYKLVEVEIGLVAL
jgi:hypothetical protein